MAAVDKRDAYSLLIITKTPARHGTKIVLAGHGQRKNQIPDWVPGFLARQKGLEPLTFWFVAKHSIQLSYWRKSVVPKYNITTRRQNQVFFIKILILFYI